MLHDGELPHAEIARHAVIPQRDLHVVEERILRRPRAKALRRDGRDAVAVFVRPLLRNDLPRRAHRDACARRRVRVDVPAQALFIEVRRQPDILYVILRHALEPDRLPDAARRGVPDAAAPVALLAEGIDAALRVVRDGDGQPVLTRDEQLRNIQTERQIPALVVPRGAVVHQHAAALIHRAEVQQHPCAAEALRQRERPLVPERLAASQLETAPGEQALRRKRHEDLPHAAARIFLAVLHRVVPQAVEAEVAIPHELRPRILRERAGTVNCLAPRGVKLLHVTAPPRAGSSRRAGSAACFRITSA